MDKPKVKFRTPSSKSSKSAKSESLNESFNTTRDKFLTAPEVPISNEEARKREEKLREMKKLKDREKKRKKRTKSRQKDLVLADDDLDGRRIQELQERHMRALDDLTRLRDHYYHEYKDLLDAKVIQQRKDIKKKSDELERKIELKKLKEMEASHHVKKRLTKSVANIDNTFLKNLPKSKMYKIMSLQTKMMAEGKFTCIEDIETFWANVNDPDMFYEMLEAGGDVLDVDDVPEDREEDVRSQASHHSDESGVGSKASTVGSLGHHDRLDVNPSLFSIEESKEPSRAGTKRNSINEHRSSLGTQQSYKQSKTYYRKPVHPKVAEMEQKYPRVEFPDMQALYMDLDPPKEDPDVVAWKDDFKYRSKERNREKKRLKRMYALSRTHEASTQRLMDKNKDFSEVMDSLYISDVGGMLTNTQVPEQQLDQLQLDNTPYNYPSFNPALPLPPAIPHRSNSLTPALQEIARLLGDTIPEEREEDILSRGSFSTGRKKSSKSRHQIERDSTGSRGSSANSTGSIKRRDRHLEPISGRKPTLSVPLTMDGVIQDAQTVIKDVTCLSTLWTNYAKDLPTVR